MAARDRLVPLIVACPMFLQNLDTSVMATALPSIASSLDVEPLHLNLAIVSYLLSLAVFLPISGWLAERYGPRRVFCWAIGVFSLGSALCGLATSLPHLVLFRVLQGLGGAMMVPVGRLILLRSVSAAEMVSAMVWFTVPPTIGRMVGPLFGGALVTYTSWRWIFLVNIPFGLLGIWLARRFIADLREESPRVKFDLKGFALLALGLSLSLGALETVGKGIVPPVLQASCAAAGLALLAGYVLHALRREEPLIDLRILRFETFRAVIVGGMPLRIAIGASPFLLPLMLQLGFGLSPLASGLITVATAIGSLATRAVMTPAIRRFGFRPLLIGATISGSLCYAAYGLFTPATPHPLMFVTLMAGGLVNSMAMVSLGTLGFTRIPKPRMSHATAINSMAQQLAQALGVTLGAGLVTLVAYWHGGTSAHLQARDFSPAFFLIGLMTLLPLLWFWRLDPDEGAELRGR
jgi:EmrB/QacA subfamily drug resistance transporter